MPRIVKNCTTLALIAASVMTANAQSTPLADSATKLVRAGRWEDAGQFAILSWSAAKTLDDQCALLATGIDALARTGRLENAQDQLAKIDRGCGPATSLPRARMDSLRPELSLPPLPTTGLDFSAIDAFWRVASILQRDAEPTAAAWHELFATTGYRLSMRLIGTTRRDVEIALRPSNRAAFDSVSKRPATDDRANRIRHIALAATNQAELSRYRDSLARGLPIQKAVGMAARFLPPSATEGKQPPLVAFAIFRDDAYSLGPGQIVVDLEHVYAEGGLDGLLAHEFHHSYLAALNRVRYPITDDAAVPLIRALASARNEGIADLIDKPHPLAPGRSPLMAAYAQRYNEAYARTPQVVHSIDSALVVAAEDSTKLREIGARVATLLPSNGHYNGSYVAREIYETFGVDSLYPGVSNPFRSGAPSRRLKSSWVARCRFHLKHRHSSTHSSAASFSRRALGRSERLTSQHIAASDESGWLGFSNAECRPSPRCIAGTKRPIEGADRLL